MKNMLNLRTEAQPWPLVNVGDEKFFGYVALLLLVPVNWTEDHRRFVGFAYNDTFSVYEMPDDERLVDALAATLKENLFGLSGSDHTDIYGKVWIKKTDSGYEVSGP